MKRSRLRGVWPLLAVVLIAACGRGGDGTPSGPAATPPAPAAAAPARTRGAPALPAFPTLRVQALDGSTWDLAQQRGNWVLINYWATWCGPCLEEMPELSALAAMRQHIKVIGLAYDEAEPAELRAFLVEHPVTYPIARISIFAPPADFGVPRTLPTSWLIAPDGRVARKYSGQVTARMLEDDIAARGGPKAG